MFRITASVLVVLAMSAGVARAVYPTNAFPNLPAFSSPIDVVDPRDGTDRLFVVERAGVISVFKNDVSVTQRSLFLDIADSVTTQSEGGLLGLAFHPNYETNRYFYVVYTNEGPRRTILSRFTTNALNPNVADPNSELRLIELPQVNLYHKGGHVTFGPDGYLYLGLGEDGGAHHSQELGRLEGKLLRIDVDHPSGGFAYGIPPSNPFAGNPNGYREEIYAYGFRNPWRWSFDPATGKLWLGDVGQNQWEEIDIVKKGRNYGWPRMEGKVCYSPSVCDTAGLNIDLPLFVYSHNGSSASITGGYVYCGASVPSLAGKYVYADFITGRIGALAWDGVNPPVDSEVYFNDALFVSSFGVDKDNELFFTSFDGTVYKFVDSPVTSVRAPSPSSSLVGIHPNPFGTETTVEYSLAERANVALEVFDVRGRRVAALVEGVMEAGPHTAVWNARDAGERRVTSGVYFCRLTVQGRPAGTMRLTLLK